MSKEVRVLPKFELTEFEQKDVNRVKDLGKGDSELSPSENGLFLSISLIEELENTPEDLEGYLRDLKVLNLFNSRFTPEYMRENVTRPSDFGCLLILARASNYLNWNVPSEEISYE